MVTQSSTTIQPVQQAKETLLGMMLSLEQRYGCQPLNDKNTTLNKKFDVFLDEPFSNPKLVQYFCWGVEGRVNDNVGLSSARLPLGTDMALYGMRPFRAVTLEEDLSAEERANYAMRQIVMRDGIPWCLYWLKKIDFTQGQVQFLRTDAASGVVSDYPIDYGNLNPTPPTPDSNGVISDVADSISIVLPGTVTLTGQEVYESVAFMDGGDPRYAVMSELGFVSASTKSVSMVDAASVPFSYTEALMAQLVDHYTSVGVPFFSTSDSWSKTIQFSQKNLINQ